MLLSIVELPLQIQAEITHWKIYIETNTHEKTLFAKVQIKIHPHQLSSFHVELATGLCRFYYR